MYAHPGLPYNVVSIGCNAEEVEKERRSHGLSGGLSGDIARTPESGTLLLVGCGMFCIVLIRKHTPALLRFGSTRSL